MATAQQNFYLDKLKSNTHARILISDGTNDIFVGSVRNDLTIAIGAQYSSFFKIASLDKASEIINQFSIAMGSVSKVTGGSSENLANIQLKTPALTSLVWLGTEAPTFTVPLTILAWREGDNVLKVIKQLYKTVLPTTGTIKGFNALMKAPMGYTAGSAFNEQNPSGTLTIKIGTWFSAQHQIMQNVSFDISRIASNSQGEPLYADGAITFRPYRDITFEDFTKFFPTVK